jgi:pilus assembly protein Flp/PilA
MLSYYVSITNFLADRLRRDDRGATAVEYGLLVALIAAVIVGIVFTLGGQIKAAFQTVSGQLP